MVEKVEELVYSEDPRGFVYRSGPHKNDYWYLVRFWLPGGAPAEKRSPQLRFSDKLYARSDARCPLPDGCQVIVGHAGVPRLAADHLGTAIKKRVLGGLTRSEAWALWELENGQRREESEDWQQFPQSRPGTRVERVVYVNLDGSRRSKREL